MAAPHVRARYDFNRWNVEIDTIELRIAYQSRKRTKEEHEMQELDTIHKKHRHWCRPHDILQYKQVQLYCNTEEVPALRAACFGIALRAYRVRILL